MNITKRDAFKAGLSMTIKRIARGLVDALILFAVLGILGAAFYGLICGFWLTMTPRTTPLWWVWTTRASALVIIAYGLWATTRHLIKVGQTKLLENEVKEGREEDAG